RSGTASESAAFERRFRFWPTAPGQVDLRGRICLRPARTIGRVPLDRTVNAAPMMDWTDEARFAR
ncbi:MAG: hypothetical protein WAK94_11500, partial [Steroidobacteraceae bacterium]